MVRSLVIASGCAGFVVVLLFCLLGIYAHPMADDFSFVHNTPSVNTLWEAVSDFYFRRAGLYTAVGFRFLHATSTRMNGYEFIAASVVLSHLFLLYLLFRKIAHRFDACFLAVGFLSTYLAIMPNVGGVLYWATGAIVYSSGTLIILATLVLWIGVWFNRTNESPSLLQKGVLVCALFLLVGVHYPFSIWSILWVWVLAVAAVQCARQDRLFWIGTALFITALFVVVFLAPGNFARAELASAAGGPSVSEVAKSGLSLLNVVIGSSLGLPVICLSIYLFLSRRQCLEVEFTSLWLVWLGVLVAVGTYLLAGFGGMYPPKERTQDVIGFMLIVGTVLSSAFARGGIYADVRRMSVCTERWKATLAVVFALSIVGSSNVRLVLADLVTHGPAFDSELDARADSLSKAASRGDNCGEVSPLRNKPSSFHIDDLSDSPDDWKMPSMARFYGLERLVLKGHGRCRR